MSLGYNKALNKMLLTHVIRDHKRLPSHGKTRKCSEWGKRSIMINLQDLTRQSPCHVHPKNPNTLDLKNAT